MRYKDILQIEKEIQKLKSEIALHQVECVEFNCDDIKKQIISLEENKAKAVESIPRLSSLEGNCLILHIVYKYSWNKIAMIIGGNNSGECVRKMCYRYNW